MRAALMLAVLLAAVLTVWVADRAVSDDAPCAQYAVQSAARERPVSGTGPRVVVVGDSWSAGLGLGEPGRSWPSRLEGRVQVFGFSGSGFSATASTCPGVAFAERARRAVRGADLVVVQGGLNDHDQSPASVRDGVRRLLRVVGDREVVLVGPAAAPSRTDGARRVDALLSGMAEDAGVRFVSTYGLELDYLDDDLHLTVRGHRDFGHAVAAALAAS